MKIEVTPDQMNDITVDTLREWHASLSHIDVWGNEKKIQKAIRRVLKYGMSQEEYNEWRVANVETFL